MQITSFRLRHLGRFDQLEVPLAPHLYGVEQSRVTVFIGNNGAGKTSVLKALATSLSWFVARLRSEKGNGSPIPEGVILNGHPSAAIDLQLLSDNRSRSNPNANIEDYIFSWTLARTVKGKKSLYQSNLSDLSRIVDLYRSALSANDNASLPLIAFYPVERVVLDIPLKIKERHSFRQLDGYDNALNQGVDFRRFFEWFREREDSENESSLPQDVLDHLLSSVSKNSEIWQKLQELMISAKDRQLMAVRQAIENFMPGFTHLRVRRKPRLHMSIDKNGQTLNVLQLSQGEKSLMALVGDIARRLAMMNPMLENPLHGEGIVLIDEVDMHLHPSWQRNIVKGLTETFPNCQFILTTHSPLVVGDCQGALVYSLENGELIRVPSQFGEDANTVLLDVMGTDIRNSSIAIELDNLRDHIQRGQLNEARTLLTILEAKLPVQNFELVKAKLLLRKMELRLEKD